MPSRTAVKYSNPWALRPWITAATGVAVPATAAVASAGLLPVVVLGQEATRIRLRGSMCAALLAPKTSGLVGPIESRDSGWNAGDLDDSAERSSAALRRHDLSY